MLILEDKIQTDRIMAKNNKNKTHADQIYIEALKKNNNILIDEIYVRFYPEVQNFVLRNNGSKDQAKNLFQKTLIALWEKVQSTEIILTVPFGAFFYPMYRFKWLNYLNRDKHRIHTNTPLEVLDTDKYVDTVIDYFVDDEESIKERRWNVFNECFKQLSKNCQTMLNLKFQGKRSKEIAKIVERASANAIDGALLVCRRSLSACIEAHPDYKTLKM